MVSTQITDLLVHAITDHLDTAMRVNVSSSDPGKAKTVKAYRFQANPITDNIYIWVAGGDPGDPKFRDGRVSVSQMDDLGFVVPAGEIGGGHYWWRRGRVGLGCYFVQKNFEQEVAARHARNVLARAEYEIENVQVAGIVDSWGEVAYQILVYASTFTEGGGPPDQYLWRGEIYWQVLTHRPI
jgi:hypothetical protein